MSRKNHNVIMLCIIIDCMFKAWTKPRNCIVTRTILDDVY